MAANFGVRIFRVRLVLRMTAPARLHAHHAAILYSTLAQAHGIARQGEPCVPDGVLLDAPEQARLSLAGKAPYAFGFTLLASSEQEAARLTDLLVLGLRKLGRRKDQPRVALGGNFDVELVQDLVAGRAHRTGQPLESIPPEWMAEEIARIAPHGTLTLRFISPLRAHRSKKSRRDGHQFFDREHFQPWSFVQRLAARLRALGIEPPAIEGEADATGPTVDSNRLVWLDLSYGPRQTRKALGGAVGRVTLGQVSPAVAACLVWGQYVRIGEATRFGFGNYRIEELGPAPFACPRSVGLLTLATDHPALDEAAEKWDLAAGESREAARQLAAGTYRARPHVRVDLPKPDGGVRTLSIPSRLDRVLQRAVLDTVAPAVELFLEESSLAYRRGLGRHTAARRLRSAFAEGFRWGLKADFLAFFDSVDHQQLRERLAAYTADDQLTDSLMLWVESGSPRAGQGVPTGAPLSPLLTNLFLDEFDEAMERLGRRLVRYADDFVILFRDREQADAVLSEARHVAEQLQLKLNQDKTRTLELGSPFEFLGFRFEPRDGWEFDGQSGPRPVEELGWRDRPRRDRGNEQARLSGESEIAALLPGTLIAGPRLDELLVHNDNLQFKYLERSGIESVPLVGLREVIVIGPATLSRRVLDVLQRQAIELLLVDESARYVTSLDPSDVEPDALGVIAQVDASRREEQRLEIGRRLVSAKLHNYAALAEAYPDRHGTRDCEFALRRLSKSAEVATGLDELLGIEGSGAAIWYGAMGPRLPAGFHWERRVAPAATDPVNILLNLAQTVLHRWTQAAIRQAKLVDALGLLHVPRAGHAALASDLQEPFRHLMDRAVLETLRRIRPEEFEADERGPFPARIKPRALREALAWIHRILAVSCHGAGQSEPLPYRLQIWKQVRALRRSLLNPEIPFEPFRHP